MKILRALLALVIFPCISKAEAVSHEFIALQNSKIEYFVAEPSGPGPFPVLIFVHPHQEWPYKIGARAFLKNGELSYWAKQGFIAVALSQPGYGDSSGSADFCGPDSQAAAQYPGHPYRQDHVAVSRVPAACFGTQYRTRVGIYLHGGDAHPDKVPHVAAPRS